MITVKQILEQYDIVTDKASSHDLYLADLASSGIIEESKIPMLRRSLNKNINEMTVAEKKSLVSLIESLMTEKSDGGKSYPSDKDMPAVIILKRKAIRVFPDKQKVGLYYSQALDRYISIPFGPNAKDLSPQLNEEIINEISQEKAQSAYLERMRRKDASTDPEEKAAHELALANLTKRMKTKIPGKREWKKPVKTAKQAYKKEVAASKEAAAKDAAAAKEHPFQSILWKGLAKLAAKIPGSYDKRMAAKMAAKAKPSQSAMRMLQQKKSSPTEVPAASTPATTSSVKSGRTIGPSASSKPPSAINRPVSVTESFKDNLRIIREERQLDEVSWEDVKSGISTAADIVAPGVKAVGQKIVKGEMPSLGDVGSAALDVGTLAVGGGLGAAGVKGAIAGVRALRAGKSVGQAAKFAKQSAARSTGWKIARGIGSGAGKLAAGAAGAAGALGSAASALGDAFKPIDPQPQHNFTQAGSGAAPKVSGPKSITGAESGMDAAAIKRQQQVFGVGVQNESTISTLKQIVENNVPSQQLQIGEETISINKSIAKKIVKLHESLNRTNKKKLERMLNEDIVSFRKVVNFALK